MKPIYGFLEERVLPPDGKISTCCLDPLGEKACSSIHDSDFASGKQRCLAIYRQISETPDAMVRCARCFAQLQKPEKRRGKRYVLFTDRGTAQKALQKSRTFPKRAVIGLTPIRNPNCREWMQYRANIPGTRDKAPMDIDPLEKRIEPGMSSLEKVRPPFWNDSGQERARAVELAREVGVDKVQFTPPGSPSPSKRFTGSPNMHIKIPDFSPPSLKDSDLEFRKHLQELPWIP